MLHPHQRGVHLPNIRLGVLHLQSSLSSSLSENWPYTQATLLWAPTQHWEKTCPVFQSRSISVLTAIMLCAGNKHRKRQEMQLIFPIRYQWVVRVRAVTFQNIGVVTNFSQRTYLTLIHWKGSGGLRLKRMDLYIFKHYFALWFSITSDASFLKNLAHRIAEPLLTLEKLIEEERYVCNWKLIKIL